ncbi:MAG: hypothetical protein D6773_19255 [Alphaproteobacteria bacterium]|nr:MAG: hypothetical protein D6773_19255 [Alphaproteobacteria bacterium]
MSAGSAAGQVSFHPAFTLPAFARTNQSRFSECLLIGSNCAWETPIALRRDREGVAQVHERAPSAPVAGMAKARMLAAECPVARL